MTPEQIAQLLQAPIGQDQENSFAKRNKEFGELGSPSFNGDDGLVEADKRLQSCEKIFVNM